MQWIYVDEGQSGADFWLSIEVQSGTLPAGVPGVPYPTPNPGHWSPGLSRSFARGRVASAGAVRIVAVEVADLSAGWPGRDAYTVTG